MKLAKVVGSVVATRKDDRLVGHKLLVVQMLIPGREGIYRPGRDEWGFAVAVDLVGSGTGETVILCSGSSARSAGRFHSESFYAGQPGIIGQQRAQVFLVRERGAEEISNIQRLRFQSAAVFDGFH